MKSNKQVISLVGMIALVALTVLGMVSAANFGSISSVEVNGVEAVDGSANVAALAGQTLPVRIVFTATENASDVRIKAWITGDKDVAVSSERFDVIAGSVYSRLVTIQVPFALDPTEALSLELSVESRSNGVGDTTSIKLAGQRESYLVQVLDVSMDSKVTAGDVTPVDIVIKNRGSHFAEDTFVKVSIPALGVEQRAYFGDLSPVDQADPDEEDAVERRLFLRIPSNAPAGVYAVQIDAYNSDSETTTTKKLAIVGTKGDTAVISSVQSKTFGTNDVATYSLTLVNSGSKVQVYDLVFDTPEGLTLNVEDSVVVVPAGSSRTVKMDVSASKANKYNFAVDVNANGELVKRSEFVANVEGNGVTTRLTGNNAAVLLTVVLAIVFVVLLVVLIVLLTRKPKKSEEFGESYY